MAKPNYAFAKHQRDLAKKKKKEEKRKLKAEAKQQALEADGTQQAEGDTSESTPDEES